MLSELTDLSGQIALLQTELQKPFKRIKILSAKVDEFGDAITDEQKEAHFAKAKEDFVKIKVMCEKTIKELPKMKNELHGRN